MVQKGPRPLVLCGPSGSGKSTLLKRLLKEFPDKFGFSVSHTTRGPRPGEKDGVHYHFTNKDNMLAAIKRGEFIETATFSGNMYGTSKRAVDDVRYTGKICVLDIEIEGVKQVKETDLDPLLVFVMPPSIDELERRLRARNTEHEDALRKRLETARREIEFGQEPGNFHIIILNDTLDKAYSELRDFIAQNVEDKEQGRPWYPDMIVHYSTSYAKILEREFEWRNTSHPIYKPPDMHLEAEMRTSKARVENIVQATLNGTEIDRMAAF